MRSKMLIIKLTTVIMALALALTGCGNDLKDDENNNNSVPPSQNTAEAVSLELKDYKSNFFVGDTFDAGDIVVEITYDDNTKKVAKSDEYEIDLSSFNISIPGQSKVKVVLKDSTISSEYSVNAYRSKDSLKILAIGNSFSDDGLQHIYSMAQELGFSNIVIANLYIGGCSLATHANNAQNNSNAYVYKKNSTGTWVNNNSKSILYGLQDEAWDIISLQQASGDSGQGQTYDEDLDYLLDYVEDYKGDNTNIVWQMTWAYPENSTHASFTNYNSSQEEMYQSIVATTQIKIVANNKVDLIIPSGTTIQNLRNSYLGDNLHRDMTGHLSWHTGRYAAGMTWLKVVSGYDIDQISWIPQYNPAWNSDPTISADRLELIKECVNLAIDKPYAVSLTDLKDPDSIADIDFDQYQLLNWKPLAAVYWNSTNDSGFNTLHRGDNISCNYVSSAIRFTQDDIPIGSIISIDSGWQYRPDGWTQDNVKTTNRPNNITKSHFIVNQDWWMEFSLRSFNVSKIIGGDISRIFDIAGSALKIWIPNTVIVPPVNMPDDTDRFDSIGKNIQNYETLMWTPSLGYYNSSKGENLTVSDKDGFCLKYISSQRFTETQIPVGSIVIVDEGWKYRPEAWSYSGTRPSEISGNSIIEVSDAWWGNYTSKAFNLTEIVQSELTFNAYEAWAHLRIYVPIK